MAIEKATNADEAIAGADRALRAWGKLTQSEEEDLRPSLTSVLVAGDALAAALRQAREQLGGQSVEHGTS